MAASLLAIQTNGQFAETVAAVCDYPAASDVLLGVSYGSGAYTGSLVASYPPPSSELFTGLLNKSCTIQRPSSSGVGAGGRDITTFAELSTGNACRLNPGTGQEYIIDRQTVVAEFVLFLNGDVDITEKDQVIIGSKTYEVLLVKDAAGHSHHLECDLKLVRT